MPKALLILDVQNICPVGPRAPAGLQVGERGEYPALSGTEVAGPLLSLAYSIVRHGGPVFAARDAGERVAELCVRGTDGAELNPRLRLPREAVVLAPSDGGSRFLDYRDHRGRRLGELLGRRRVSEVLVGGLTTADEFRDAIAELLAANVPTAILADAIFALDVGPGEKPAMMPLALAGARVVSTGQAIMELYGWRDENPEPTQAELERFLPGRSTRAQVRDERPRGWRRAFPGIARRRELQAAARRGE